MGSAPPETADAATLPAPSREFGIGSVLPMPKCYVTASVCVPVYLTPVLTARQTERIVVETVAAPSFMQSGIGPGLWRVLVA